MVGSDTLIISYYWIFFFSYLFFFLACHDYLNLIHSFLSLSRRVCQICSSPKVLLCWGELGVQMNNPETYCDASGHSCQHCKGIKNMVDMGCKIFLLSFLVNKIFIPNEALEFTTWMLFRSSNISHTHLHANEVTREKHSFFFLFPAALRGCVVIWDGHYMHYHWSP